MEHLFIVTYGRSGSTFLLNSLNAIEGYCLRGENGGLANKLSDALRDLRSAQETFGYQDDKGAASPWYGLTQINPDAWAKTLAAGFTADVLRPPVGTRVIGFKEVR